MNPFSFYSPTYFAFGEGAEAQTGELVRRFGGTRALLVYGGGSVKRNGAYDGVTESLRKAEIPWVELTGVQPNPRSGKVYEGIELCRQSQLDFVLAIGGGSAIDTAKAVGMGVPCPGDFWEIFQGKTPLEKCLPIGTVLTLAASGSEGSNSCVITQEKGNLKWGSPKSDLIRPAFSVLNPRFTCSLPPFQTACGAADMFAHICERYFTNTPDVDLTDRLCEALMKTAVSAGLRAMENPDDLAARGDLMWTGTLAHNNSVGIGRDQDWASHQIEHELSAFYDCAHGAGLAVVIPAWMAYVMDHNPARFARYAVNVFGCEMDFACPERTAREGIARTRAFFRDLGLPATLEDLGAKAEDIPAMVAHRREKPNGFPFGGFVKIGPKEMEDILRLCASS